MIAVALLGALVACSGSDGGGTAPSTDGPARPPPDAPNIVLVVTDDQRDGTLSMMPAVRRYFAREGRTFANAFVTTPLCCPSRGTIFSGRYAHNHLIKTNHGPGIKGFDERNKSLQNYLSGAGYETAIFGKYFNKWPITEPPPHFGRWAIFSAGNPFYTPTTDWNVNGEVVNTDQYSTSYITDHAVDFLRASENRDERPWLLVLTTAGPHGPARPQHKYRHARIGSWAGNPAVRERDRSDKPPLVQAGDFGLSFGSELRKRQLRNQLSIDDMVDSVFETMRNLDEERDTLAVFMSDNGILWGDHGLNDKRWPYTASIEVPLLLRWPGRIETGSVDHRLVANVDIMPTLLKAAGVEPDTELDGYDLLGRHDRRVLLTEHWKMPGVPEPTWASIRTRAFQYVEYYRRDGTVTFREYYDLARDPWQLDNLLRDATRDNDPDVSRLGERLRRVRECEGTGCP